MNLRNEEPLYSGIKVQAIAKYNADLEKMCSIRHKIASKNFFQQRFVFLIGYNRNF